MSHHEGIAAVLRDFYASFASGQISEWEDHIAEDAVAVGTDEQEWVVGRAAILELLRAQTAEMSAAGISLSAGDPIAVEHGDLAVISDRPTIHLPDGFSQVLRATMAGSRTDGEILIHQMHLSAPAPNADVVQTELTLPTP